MQLLQIILLSSLLLFSPLLPCVLAAPPAIPRSMEMIEATIEAGGPQTIDPAACYDTASGELLMNMYDTLITFNGERLDKYVPMLASSWAIENIEGQMNGDLSLYYRYTFVMNGSAHFWNGDPVTAADVEYCYEREMFMDFAGGPQWMFFEPLLNNWGILGMNTTNLEGNGTEQARIAGYIDRAIESNATHVWFDLAFPGAYAPFLSILSQTWSSIYSKAWSISLHAMRPSNWDGDYATWFESWRPALPPFDDPTPAAMGSGPFVFEEWNPTLMQWSVVRNHNYFRGWPLDWPAFAGSRPAGYVEHFVCSFAWTWDMRSVKFLNGEVDFCSVPRQYMAVVLNQPGIRCIYPLPNLSADALLYNFDVNPTTPFGPVFDYGVFNESGIPRDFFADVNIRKAFSHCINFTTLIDTNFIGEAVQPPTAIILGLPQYDPTIQKYNYDLAEAAALFQTSPCWTTGFTIQMGYFGGAFSGTVQMLLAAAINSLNPKFHASAVAMAWADFLYARDHGQLTCFTLGWLADYPDAHNFAFAFYYSQGNFAWRQNYANPTMDALIEAGILTPEGPERTAIYRQLQQLVIDDCPSVALDQRFDRHFERTWVCGWYYNPTWYTWYTGIYAGNLWKWYYTPHAQMDTVTNATANLLPYDVNYDGKIDMKDIGAAAASFETSYGPPIGSRWNFKCDFNNDREIDMKDISRVAQDFGKTSTPWTPQLQNACMVFEAALLGSSGVWQEPNDLQFQTRARETHDILYVKEFLRHRKIQNTMIYISLEKQIFQIGDSRGFHVKIAKTIVEACELAKAGFEKSDEFSEGKIY